MTEVATSEGSASPTIIAVAGLFGALLAAALLLWAYYGTTVFFEMVRTGWAACF